MFTHFPHCSYTSDEGMKTSFDYPEFIHAIKKEKYLTSGYKPFPINYR